MAERPRKRYKRDGVHPERNGEDGHRQKTVAFLSQRSYAPSERKGLKVSNHFVLPIANPFLLCPIAFYIIMGSNKRSLLNKRTNYFFFYRIQKTISVTPGSRRKPITLATAGAICLNWAVTCRIRDQASRHTSTPTTWFGSGAFEDEAEVEGMYSFAVGTINVYGN